jgi:DNA-directed RNA polymerase subunit K/omega
MSSKSKTKSVKSTISAKPKQSPKKPSVKSTTSAKPKSSPKKPSVKSTTLAKPKKPSVKSITSAKPSPKKKVSKRKNDVIKKETDIIELEEIDEDKFFDADNFKEFDDIKYKIYDPDKFTNITHKEITIIPSQSRRTSDLITKYEYTEVISIRAKQIENGSKVFIDIKDMQNPIEIAENEVKQRQCPLSIRRMLSDKIAEIWEVNELIIPY